MHLIIIYFHYFGFLIYSQEALNTIFTLTIKRYMRAGAGQFLRDFRLAHR